MSAEKSVVKIIKEPSPAGAGYLLTFIGAAIYFIQQTNGSFLEVVVALLQAAIWPVYVVYHVLLLLGV